MLRPLLHLFGFLLFVASIVCSQPNPILASNTDFKTYPSTVKLGDSSQTICLFSDCSFNVTFQPLTASSQYIDITLQFQINNASWAGWFGFGLSHNFEHMYYSDVMLCYFDSNNQPQVADMFITGSVPPQLDTDLGGQNNIQNVGGSASGGYHTVSFRRALITGDVYDTPIYDYGMGIIAAYGPFNPNAQFPKNIMGHKSHNGVSQIDFYHPQRSVVLSSSACLSPDESSFCISWVVYNDNNIVITLNATNSGWVGIGFAPQPLMNGADIIIGYINATTGQAEARDMYAPSQTRPVLDETQGGTDDVRVIDGEAANNRLIIRFERKLDTGDTKTDLAITNTSMNILWAYSTLSSSKNFPSFLNMHGRATRGAVSLNLLSPNPAPPTPASDNNIMIAHAILMSVAWMILTPIAVIIARFFKNHMPIWWFRHHTWMMLSVIAITSAAFGLAIVMRDGLAFDYVHNVLGFLVFICCVLQGGLGWLADKMFNPARKSAPVFPDIIHQFFGRGIWIVAVVNIYLGLSLVEAHLAFFVLYYIAIAAYIAIFVFAKQPEDKHMEVLKASNSSEYGSILKSTNQE